MNVFVLSTGRCGSTTFAEACRLMTNYTAAHESERRRDYGKPRERYRSLDYPDNHIEVDNRLSWFLGSLDERYGKDAFYVHLVRDRDEVAGSFLNRWEQRKTNIIFSFAWGVLTHPFDQVEDLSRDRKFEIGRQYWDTVNDNIRLFLRDKPNEMTIHLEDIREGFNSFWKRIGAEGDLEAALAVWDTKLNASPTSRSNRPPDEAGVTASAGIAPQSGKDPVLEISQPVARALQSSAKVDLGQIHPPVEAGKWTLTSETLRFLVSLVDELQPSHVMEFGSGLSTRVLAWACARLKEPCRITSIDHDPEFLDQTRALLKTASGHPEDAIVFAPVVARKFAGNMLPAYNLPREESASWGTADLVIIDGPPRALGGREAVLYQAMEFARPGTIVLLDDAARAEEQVAISRWRQNLGEAVTIELLPGFPKGLAVITIVEPVQIEDLPSYVAGRVARKLLKRINGNAKWIVVDDGLLTGGALRSPNVLPFLERNGEYWGSPSDDDEAVSELRRLRKDGATHIAFLHESRWWLEHYPGFGAHVRLNFKCIDDDEDLIVYELKEIG